LEDPDVNEDAINLDLKETGCSGELDETLSVASSCEHSLNLRYL
jgi:hypothetical protein